MAPRLSLLLLLAVASASTLLAASPARGGRLSRYFTAADPAVERVDDVLANASRLFPPDLHRIVGGDGAGLGTAYDVTVVFRATHRVGPPRLQYAVVPADAARRFGVAEAIFSGGLVMLLCALSLFIGFIIFAHKRLPRC